MEEDKAIEKKPQNFSLTVRVDENDMKSFREFTPFFDTQSELFAQMLKMFRASNGIEAAQLQRDLQQYLDHNGAMTNLLSSIVKRTLSIETRLMAEADRKCGDQRAEIERLQDIIKTKDELLASRIAAAVAAEQGKAAAQAEKMQARIDELQKENGDYKEQVLISTKERLAALEAAKKNEEAAKENDSLKAQLHESEHQYKEAISAEAKKQEDAIVKLESTIESLRTQIEALNEENRKKLEEQAKQLSAQAEFDKNQALLAASQRHNDEIEAVRKKAYERVDALMDQLNEKKVTKK